MAKSTMFIVLEESTKELYSFNGATKASEFIGVSSNTLYRNATNTFTDKIYNGYRFAKSKHNLVPYRDRGSKIK